jgi:Na+-transporting NADH:ubiquinone oxidoreductase subunit NqrE
MPNVDINWIAVIAATVVNMVVGFIWYSPALFAKPWSKLTGRKMNEMGDGSTSYIITTVAALIQNIILSYVVGWSGVTTAIKGAWLGFLIWVAFVAVTQGVNTVFAGGRKKLWAINTGYFLVVLLINGALLAAWR